MRLLAFLLPIIGFFALFARADDGGECAICQSTITFTVTANDTVSTQTSDPTTVTLSVQTAAELGFRNYTTLYRDLAQKNPWRFQISTTVVPATFTTSVVKLTTPNPTVISRYTTETAIETFGMSITTVGTSYTLPLVRPWSRCTPTVATRSISLTTDEACPTPYENYCGYINASDPCAIQPNGHLPLVNPDTLLGFYSSKNIHRLSMRAEVPEGFVEAWAGRPYALDPDSRSPHLLLTAVLPSYDPGLCAEACLSLTEADGDGYGGVECHFFNLFAERSPAINPVGCRCADPPSFTTYTCTMWSTHPKYMTEAKYKGRGRINWFDSGIAASNAYVRSPKKFQHKPPVKAFPP